MRLFVVRFGYIAVFADDIREDERTSWPKSMHVGEEEVLLSPGPTVAVPPDEEEVLVPLAPLLQSMMRAPMTRPLYHFW
jgi:hypothetical protein